MLKQVVVNGVSYLGVLTVGEGKTVVEKAMQLGGAPTKLDVDLYLQKENLGQLKDITFGGSGVSFSEVDLDQEIKFALEVSNLLMVQAKKVAVKNLENAEFRSGLGKR